MTDEEIIAVVAAHKEGKQIQARIKDTEKNEWVDANNPPRWIFDRMDYRVKPEPPREWWFVKDIGERERYGWSRHDVKQEGVDYLEQVHVREVLEKTP